MTASISKPATSLRFKTLGTSKASRPGVKTLWFISRQTTTTHARTAANKMVIFKTKRDSGPQVSWARLTLSPLQLSSVIRIWLRHQQPVNRRTASTSTTRPVLLMQQGTKLRIKTSTAILMLKYYLIWWEPVPLINGGDRSTTTSITMQFKGSRNWSISM